MSTLVIKAWRADTKPIDDQNNFVSITGRKGGLIAWILSLMGIEPTTNILVGLERIEFTSASLAGTESRLIPLQSVCSSYYGYHRPWKAAAWIIAAFVFIGVTIGSMVAGGGYRGGALAFYMMMSLVGVVIGLIYYFLNTTLTLGFVEHSGVVNGIRFKRSVIENVDINEEQSKIVCIIVQRLIEARERRTRQAVNG